MKKNVRFYKCEVCGNQIGLIHSNGNPVFCCNKEMKQMDIVEKNEKHTPQIVRCEDEIVVTVGTPEHDMTKEHYIMWVALVSENVTMRTTLYPEQSTTVRFKYIPNSLIYVYCNKHGLTETLVEEQI